MAIILPVPESEKRVLDNLLRDLKETYPDKVIRNLGRDHKNWSEKVTRLYKNIGYESRDEFLAAYGFTTEEKTKGRPSDDLDAIVEELIGRYKGNKYVTSLDQLKEENPDLAPKFKNLQNKAKDLFGMSFNKYLKEKGVFQSDKSAAEERAREYREKLDAIIDELKKRYEGVELPKTIVELIEANSDIEDIANIGTWIDKAYHRHGLEYLVELGLVCKKEKKPEKTEEEIAAANFRKLSPEQKLEIVTEELKKRVAADGERVHTIELLREKYPDLPVQTIDAWSKKVYEKNAKQYLIEEGIMKSIREVCIDHIKQYNSLNMKHGFLLEEFDASIMRKLSENNAILMDQIPPLGKGYYFVIDTDDKSPFGGAFWENFQNKQLQKQLIDPSFKVKFISKANLGELLGKKDKHTELFNKEDRKAKCERAMKVFISCVNKVEQYMDKTNDYNSPAASPNSIVQGRIVHSVTNVNNASDFFDAAVNWMEENEKGYDFSIDSRNMRKWYEETYKKMLQRGTFWFDGEAGVRYPVGLVVAYMTYVDPKATIAIEFVRDKWELRGDYNSSKRVCLEMGDYGYDINVHYNYYDAYHM